MTACPRLPTDLAAANLEALDGDIGVMPLLLMCCGLLTHAPLLYMDNAQ